MLSLLSFASAAEPPVLVELFTSEGCSSCPPADTLVAALAEDPRIVLLSWHVDYWNRLGWADPFSSRAATERQAAYVRALGLSGAYTPQVVVDGRTEAVGSDRAAVSARIAGAPALAWLSPTVVRAPDGSLRVHVADGAVTAHAAVVQHAAESVVPRGENAGRTLRHRDVVRTSTSGGADLVLRVTRSLR